MTADMLDLARRAAACKGLRWMPGMLVSDGVSVAWRVHHDGARLVAVPNVPGWAPMLLDHEKHLDMFPVLTDPATLGCLLALVREAYGDSALYVRLSDTTRQSDGARAWEVLGWLSPERSRDGRVGSWRGWGYASEAEALVAALEAAPQ